MSLAVVEKRPEVIFARVTATNKKFLRDTAKAFGQQEGPFLNEILTMLRETPEGKKLLATNGVETCGGKRASKSNKLPKNR